MCRGPCRTCRASWPSSHTLCVMALFMCAVCHGPCHAHHVSQPLSCMPCVVALIMHTMCHGPCRAHRASLLSLVRFWFCTQNMMSQNKNKVATHLLILAHCITADASTSPHGGGQHWCRTCRQNMSKQDKAVTYLYTESMEWQVKEWGEVEVGQSMAHNEMSLCNMSGRKEATKSQKWMESGWRERSRPC